jgi:hypothetical protein
MKNIEMMYMIKPMTQMFLHQWVSSEMHQAEGKYTDVHIWRRAFFDSGWKYIIHTWREGFHDKSMVIRN